MTNHSIVTEGLRGPEKSVTKEGTHDQEGDSDEKSNLDCNIDEDEQDTILEMSIAPSPM
jgi:hypothetical protein